MEREKGRKTFRLARTLVKKTNMQYSLTATKTARKGVRNLSRDHLAMIISRLSSDISEKLRTKGQRFQSKQRNPHSSSVPILQHNIFRTKPTISTTFGWPRLTNSSATCIQNFRED